MARHQGRTALYRLFDESGRLLYIGVSHKPDVRWGQHSEEKDWWPQVDKRAVEWHDSRKAAERAELLAIAKEHPVFNVVGTPLVTVSDTHGRTPVRPIRVEATLWDEFGKAAVASDTDRSAVLRAFMAWYARRPGAKLPARPAAAHAQSEAAE